MHLVASTRFKRMAPKKGYVAPYLLFPWNARKDLIGQTCRIYQVDGGFYVQIDERHQNNDPIIKVENIKFKPRAQDMTLDNEFHSGNDEFKPSDMQKDPNSGRMRRMKAGLKGFEPLAYGLRVRRSAKLSYKPVLAPS